MSMAADGAQYWPYIWASYALVFSGVTMLALFTLLRLRRWADKAKALETQENREAKNV